MTTEQQDRLIAIIADIRNTRAINNLNWMTILELAVLHAPEQALTAMKGIGNCDALIVQQFNSLLTELEHIVRRETPLGCKDCTYYFETNSILGGYRVVRHCRLKKTKMNVDSYLNGCASKLTKANGGSC